MTTELFDGTPEELKIRLDAIIALPATLNFVLQVAKGRYLIAYT